MTPPIPLTSLKGCELLPHEIEIPYNEVYCDNGSNDAVDELTKCAVVMDEEEILKVMEDSNRLEEAIFLMSYPSLRPDFDKICKTLAKAICQNPGRVLRIVKI